MEAFVFLKTYLASSETTGWSLGSTNWDRLMEEAEGIVGHGSGAVDDVSDDEQLVRLKERMQSR